jgi:splicing factor 3B subunit 1
MYIYIYVHLHRRLNNKNPVVRQQAAELVGRIAYVTYECDEKDLLNLLGTILHENIGEEYPDVLAAILGGLKAVGTVFEDIGDMKPAPGELLPRLVPILKNKHEKVQEQSIALVGLIADRAPDHVPPREWTRICFDLLEVFSAPRRSIVTAAIHAFGFIAKAIGPQEVIITLLDNLRVQERRSRVCTTIAIAVIADTCEPYTILPGACSVCVCVMVVYLYVMLTLSTLLLSPHPSHH